jgi:hypothetical protein
MVTQVLHCSHCHGTDIVRHGTTRQGKQRYRCRACPERGRTFLLDYAVAYLLAADNVSGPLPIRLPLVNQSVISTPNVFSTLLPSLLVDR